MKTNTFFAFLEKHLAYLRLGTRVVDKQTELVETLQTVEADASLSLDVKAEERGLKAKLGIFSKII